MSRHITVFIISILLIQCLTGCRSNSDPTFAAPENLKFEFAGFATSGPTRITWADRELSFYSISPSSESVGTEFMMVDLMGDHSIEYILRNSRLEETRFSLPDGSLVRFDLVGFQETGLDPIIYHCTPYSNALYQLDSLPEKLARNIAGFNSRFVHWENTEPGALHRAAGPQAVPFERILETVCCGVDML